MTFMVKWGWQSDVQGLAGRSVDEMSTVIPVCDWLGDRNYSRLLVNDRTLSGFWHRHGLRHRLELGFRHQLGLNFRHLLNVYEACGKEHFHLSKVSPHLHPVGLGSSKLR